MFCLIGGAHIPKEHLFERKPLFEDEGWARNVFLGENKTKKTQCKMYAYLSCSTQLFCTDEENNDQYSCHKKFHMTTLILMTVSSYTFSTIMAFNFLVSFPKISSMLLLLVCKQTNRVKLSKCTKTSWFSLYVQD